LSASGSTPSTFEPELVAETRYRGTPVEATLIAMAQKYGFPIRWVAMV
jgi:hypothetical protein